MSTPQSQTLDRGLLILEQLAVAGTPQPVMAVAASVGLHRSIAYRLLRTLEDRGFVERDEAGRFALGLTVSLLAWGSGPPCRLQRSPGSPRWSNAWVAPDSSLSDLETTQ